MKSPKKKLFSSHQITLCNNQNYFINHQKYIFGFWLPSSSQQERHGKGTKKNIATTFKYLELFACQIARFSPSSLANTLKEVARYPCS